MERVLRTLGLLAVFLAAGWAFHYNNERRLKAIDEQAALHDATGALNEEDRAFVRGFMDRLKSRFGLDCRVVAGPGAAEDAARDSKTLYLGIDPAARKVAVSLPPLMRQALGGELSGYLENEHFEPYWASGDWPQGLKTALALIWTRLDNLDRAAPETRAPATPAPKEGT